MSEIKRFPVYMVRQDDPSAMRLVRKLCEGVQPGQVIPLDKGEWVALHKSVVRLDVDVPDGVGHVS